jgi:hypothetical protein
MKFGQKKTVVDILDAAIAEAALYIQTKCSVDDLKDNMHFMKNYISNAIFNNNEISNTIKRARRKKLVWRD